jgi:hypothetical protein
VGRRVFLDAWEKKKSVASALNGKKKFSEEQRQEDEKKITKT